MDVDSNQQGYIILTVPTIYDCLYEYCSPGMLQRIARTCRAAREATADYLTHALSARYTRQLARFFPAASDVSAFRQLQADLQFLVSGSQALQLLERTVYPDSDLDIYVWPHQAKVIGEWLIARGYRYSPYNIPPVRSTFEEALRDMSPSRSEPGWGHVTNANQYGLPWALGVFNFKKHRSHEIDMVTGEDVVTTDDIQIIVARDSPLAAILHFHSSALKFNISSQTCTHEISCSCGHELRGLGPGCVTLPERNI